MHKRAHERTRAFLSAQIVVGRGASTIDCIIRNLSEGGALIEVDAAASVPDLFDLRIVKTGRTQPAGVRWRGAGHLGVQFLSRPESASTSMREAELEQKVRSLQIQLADFIRKAEAHGVAYIFKEDCS